MTHKSWGWDAGLRLTTLRHNPLSTTLSQPGTGNRRIPIPLCAHFFCNLQIEKQRRRWCSTTCTPRPSSILPWARTILGSADNIRSITSEDLKNYIATHYTGPRMVRRLYTARCQPPLAREPAILDALRAFLSTTVCMWRLAFVTRFSPLPALDALRAVPLTWVQVVAAAGAVDHDELVKVSGEAVLRQSPPSPPRPRSSSPRAPAIYTGSDVSCRGTRVCTAPDPFLHRACYSATLAYDNAYACAMLSLLCCGPDPSWEACPDNGLRCTR